MSGKGRFSDHAVLRTYGPLTTQTYFCKYFAPAAQVTYLICRPFLQVCARVPGDTPGQ